MARKSGGSRMNLEVLLESKEEYTRQLVNLTRPYFVQGIKSIYTNVKASNKQGRMILREFQAALRLVPKWSTHILEGEEARIVAGSGCSWLERLLNAVYVVNVQIMTHVANGARRSDNMQKKLNVEVPTLRSFIHKCYISLAREMWKQPFILYHGVDNGEYQKNMLELDRLVEKLMREVIRESLPYQELLDHFLGSTVEEADDDDDEEEADDEDADDEVNVHNDIMDIDAEAEAEAADAEDESDDDDDMSDDGLPPLVDDTMALERVMQSFDETVPEITEACPASPRLPPPELPESIEGINMIMTDEVQQFDESDVQVVKLPVDSPSSPVASAASSDLSLYEPVVTHEPTSHIEPDAPAPAPTPELATHIEVEPEASYETVYTEAEPEASAHIEAEPIAAYYEPLVDSPAPEQRISAAANPMVKEIVINETRRTPTPRRVRDKIQTMLGSHITKSDVKENRQQVRRLLLRQFVDA